MNQALKPILALALGLLFTLVVINLPLWARAATAPVESLNSGQHFFPPYGGPRDRFGFDSGDLTGYDVAQLHAGWYSNWSSTAHPDHPDGLVYVQLLRFEAGQDPHDPEQVTVKPSKAAIAQIAATQPGTLWLMGNEPDSLYQGTPLLPEVYAVVYHDTREYIKELDPSALIANGGIVQPTPCRLEYLDIVWDTYLDTYGEPMPVDVWNIHAFILREIFGSWGASTPPGVDASCGIDYSVDQGDDLEIFWDNIKAMRAWMKDKGYQDRPLIVSEYGILWPTYFAPQFTPARVSHFMTQTFDLFLHGTDPELGYPDDDYRLVQTWAWYSLSDDTLYNGYLFHSDTKTLSPMGETYAAYTAALSDTDYVDLSSRLTAAVAPFTSTAVGAFSRSSLTFPVLLSGSVSNLGKQPATDVNIRLQVISTTGGTTVLGYDSRYTVPARFEGIVALPPSTLTLTAPGLYQFDLQADPDAEIDEPREWNNLATATLDLRLDLTFLEVAYRFSNSIAQTGTLEITATVQNQGKWSSPVATGAVWLETTSRSSVAVPTLFSVPVLGASEQTTMRINLDWSIPEHDLYYLVLQLDPSNEIGELSEENNTYETLLPVTLTTTLMPNTTTVLTNARGTLQWLFAPGTVTTPTDIQLLPLWPIDWDTGLMNKSRVAFALTALVGGREVPVAFEKPVQVSWQYDDADIARLDEAQLRLFTEKYEGMWPEGTCRPYQRTPAENRLEVALCSGGRFLFGNRSDMYMPFSTRTGEASTWDGLMPEYGSTTPGRPERGSPLLLP